MTDPGEPEAFDDVNQAVRDEWKAETTPYERIREVISRTYTPTDAETLADEACTSPKTARKHLNTLADGGFVATETGANGATLYRRSAESLVVEQAGDILSQVSTEELRERIAEMREQLMNFQREYGVESPEELAIDRTNELLDESGDGGGEPDDETIREWKTTRRNLAFANAALSIANARRFVETGSRTDNESVSSP
ncbi:transcriptional regulator [Halobacteriales archaeon QS_4_62_28]|nr:MAG: transcriptional regulator [Halobacteriales archaeon QS_4_62_28]